MEVNKEEAVRCRDLGAEALRRGQSARAVKMFNKSLHLYPMPGVKALLGQAERRLQAEENGGSSSSNSANNTTNAQPNSNNNAGRNGFASSSRSSSSASMGASPAPSSSSSTPTPQNANTGADGRAYTEAQVSIVSQVLKSKLGGRGAHYRVLGIQTNADDSQIKKAYRKLALKLHPDKNSAPHADEAFKAVGLAYGTLSDGQKRRIYDMSGEEDPDNRGAGAARRGPGGMHFHGGQDVSPEDIFNMFFGGGGMPGGGGMGGMGGPNVRVYSSGFGGMGGPNMRARQQQQQGQQGQQQQQEGSFGNLFQLLPLLMIMLISFFNMPSETAQTTGGSRYFSLTPVNPHTNPLSTRLTKVKDIPYYVSDQFLRTVGRDRYQLSQVERMVEKSYEKYLTDECKNQKAYKRKLELLSTKKSSKVSEVERANLIKKANGFELRRCLELEDLFPQSVKEKDRVNRAHHHAEF